MRMTLAADKNCRHPIHWGRFMLVVEGAGA
jgi:hypothetical protein